MMLCEYCAPSGLTGRVRCRGASPLADIFRPFRACYMVYHEYPRRCSGLRDFAPSGHLLRCIARVPQSVAQGYGILPFQGVLYYLKIIGLCQCPKYYALSGYSYYSFPFYIGNNTAYRNIHIIIS